uniref:Uncharacterized protein n=1 Tax=Anguilla anguilla TaxID=7936 RepID=A0A0E9R1B7_ANGAN
MEKKQTNSSPNDMRTHYNPFSPGNRYLIKAPNPFRTYQLFHYIISNCIQS